MVHKSLSHSLKPEPEVQVDPAKIPRRNVFCRSGHKKRPLGIYVTRCRCIQNTCHGNGRCKHTHTRLCKQGGDLWIFSGMSAEAPGQTTASKHGCERAEEDTCQRPWHHRSRSRWPKQEQITVPFCLFFSSFSHVCTEQSHGVNAT